MLRTTPEYLREWNGNESQVRNRGSRREDRDLPILLSERRVDSLASLLLEMRVRRSALLVRKTQNRLAHVISGSIPSDGKEGKAHLRDLLSNNLRLPLPLPEVLPAPVELGGVELLVEIRLGTEPLLVLSELIPSSTVGRSTEGVGVSLSSEGVVGRSRR